MGTNLIAVFRNPATEAEPESWTARLGGPGGPTATTNSPTAALCHLLLALDAVKHQYDPSWSPDDAEAPPAD